MTDGMNEAAEVTAPEEDEKPTEAPREETSAPVVAPRMYLEQREPSNTHPLVQLAMQSGPLDTASLGELMKLQREWEAGEAKKAYTRAMVEMKRELPTVLNRDKVVDFATKTGRTTYTHTTLAAAVEAVTPHLCKFGFSSAYKTQPGERGHIEVICTLTHQDGHSESCALSGPPENSGTKNAVQAVASTVTLLERYTLLALLGIATKDQVDPQPANAQAPRTVEEILAMFAEAKVPADVRAASDAWSAIKATLTTKDKDELALCRQEAIARIEAAS